MRRRLPLSALLLLAACVPQSRPPIATRTVPPRQSGAAVVAPPPPTGDWRDWPLTPGNWTYTHDALGSLAAFGPVGQDAVLTLRCDARAHRVELARRGTTVSPFVVRTTSTNRTLPVQAGTGAIPYVTAVLSPNDPLLDAMGFSRGRFVIQQTGSPPIVVPAWAEFERVTQDCRG